MQKKIYLFIGSNESLLTGELGEAKAYDMIQKYCNQT